MHWFSMYSVPMGFGSNAKELLKGNTPTLVLSVLSEGPLHGYGIAREIERRTENALQMKEGTLYPVLHALERNEWVSSEWAGETAGRRSRVYRLTAKGLAELAERRQQWQSFRLAMDQVLEGGHA